MLQLRQLRTHGARGEKINTARTLLVTEALAELYEDGAGWPLERLAEVLDIPQTNDVSRLDRAREMLAVWAFYPAEFITYAYEHPPQWHLLIRPTRWEDVDRDEVVTFCQEAIDRRGAWPTVDALQVRFGRASNHRTSASRTEGQEALGGIG